MTPLRILLATLLILLGIWAGISVHMQRSLQLKSSIVVPAGQASPPLPPFEIDAPPKAAQIPDRLPEFSLHDLLGKVTPVSTWKGGSLVINFWATWCDPCRREIPLLNSLAAQWRSSGVTFVGIAVDYPERVQKFAQQFNIGYPLLVGEEDALDVAARFGMVSPLFPFTVFTDRNGEVVTLFVGELHPPQADLILNVMHNLDENHLELPAAREQIAAALNALAAKPT